MPKAPTSRNPKPEHCWNALADPFPRLSADPLPAGSRLACRIEYNGAKYNGWQTQPHPGVRTVQQELEAALSAVAGCEIRVHCAGRTDTGVHGHCQIVHFDAPVARAPKSWVLGANAGLPEDVRVHWALAVPGEQDFSAFRAAACQSTTPMRNVHAISVYRRGELVVIDIEANAFLHHMVRNIAGSLMAVGSDRQPPGWIAALLKQGDRTRAADTAPPDGLYLVDVSYPAHFQLPATPYGPLLLGGGELQA